MNSEFKESVASRYFYISVLEAEFDAMKKLFFAGVSALNEDSDIQREQRKARMIEDCKVMKDLSEEIKNCYKTLLASIEEKIPTNENFSLNTNSEEYLASNTCLKLQKRFEREYSELETMAKNIDGLGELFNESEKSND